MAVLDTSTRRGLVDSTYGEPAARKRHAPRWRPQPARPSLADLEERAAALTDDQHRLARHVVTENARTLATVEAMTNGDAAAVGA